MNSPIIINPISGLNSAGPRFKVRIRSLAHENMYLPVSMRSLPQMRLLLDGVSPLTVFNSTSIKHARLAFYRLRSKFDFPYWAALEFKVPDITNPHRIIPLRLNSLQHNLVDTFIHDSLDDGPRRYVITKTIPRCGLTTCIQAYIFWLQSYHIDNSITCAHSDSEMNLMKANVARFLRKAGGKHRVSINNEGISALFQSFHTPNVLGRLSGRFVHLADMAKWLDHSWEGTPHILSNALNGWRRQKAAMFVLEGDRPANPDFRMEDYRNYYIPEAVRLMQLSFFSSNPVFLNIMVSASDSKANTGYRYIDLDSLQGLRHCRPRGSQK